MVSTVGYIYWTIHFKKFRLFEIHAKGTSLRKICQNTGIIRPVFSRIRTDGKIRVRVKAYSDVFYAVHVYWTYIDFYWLKHLAHSNNKNNEAKNLYRKSVEILSTNNIYSNKCSLKLLALTSLLSFEECTRFSCKCPWS